MIYVDCDVVLNDERAVVDPAPGDVLDHKAAEHPHHPSLVSERRVRHTAPRLLEPLRVTQRRILGGPGHVEKAR